MYHRLDHSQLSALHEGVQIVDIIVNGEWPIVLTIIPFDISNHFLCLASAVRILTAMIFESSVHSALSCPTC